MRRHQQVRHEDSGAALLLAIGFVLAIGAISGGLAGLAANSLNNRNTLEVLRDREYAADTAIEIAIAQVRMIPVSACATATGVVLPVAPAVIRVDWSTACPVTVLNSDNTVNPQRNIVFRACVDAGSICPLADVITRAQVNFDPATGPVTKTFVQSWSVNR